MSRATRKAKVSTVPSYSNRTPRGLLPKGVTVRYKGGARVRNKWLKPGAKGKVFGYRPNKTGGGLYYIRFAGGTTILSAGRVTKVA